MLNDLRYAARALRKNPGFAITAIVSIALGIGANATTFSLADGLLFRPLPVARPAQVVTLRARTPAGRFGDISYPDYLDFRDKNQSFSGLVAYRLAPVGFAADARAQVELKYGYLVSGNFFQTLGVEPQLGRGFRPDEDKVPGRDAVVVLAHDFWKNEFSADPSVIGRHVRFHGLDFTVIGVAPESFTGIDPFVKPAFFVPSMMGPRLLPSNDDLLTNRGKRDFGVKGRLRPGASVRSADAEASAFAKSLEQSYPGTNRTFGAAVRTETQTQLDNSPADALLVVLLFTVVFLVLSIACANVANLMLNRGQARAREIAVRLAIGASRVRLLRQLMAESLLIGLAGGALGLFLAELFVPLFTTLQSNAPGDVPTQLTFHVDDRVLGFTILVSIFSAVLFGLVPSLRATSTDLVPALKSGLWDQTRKRLFGRSALVSVQIAGSLVLMTMALQMLSGSALMLQRGPGYRISHLILMRFDPSLGGYTPAQTEQFYKTLVDRASAIPGVKSAALTGSLPSSNNQLHAPIVPEGYQFPRGTESLDRTEEIVDRAYFQTLGIPLLEGRGFLPADRADSPYVAVVSEVFARKYFGGHALGRRLRLNGKTSPWLEVVGVAANTKYSFITLPPDEMVYVPLSQHPQPQMKLVAESFGDAVALAAPLKALVTSIDPSLPIFAVGTMEDYFEQRTVRTLNLFDRTVGILGLVGMGLALVGLYAIVSYQVTRKTREIGIRMAIGAAQRQVVAAVLRQAALMGLAGVGIGLALSPAGRALTTALGSPGFNPLLFSAVPVGLLLITLLAAAIPARRAARVDPMTALRQD
jgi:predicted permease